MAAAGHPTGTVSFLFTDIEGSTQLWDSVPASMAAALEAHDTIMREAISAAGGYIFATGGDGFCVAFQTAESAAAAAIDAQRRLLARGWPPDCVLRVRMGIHAGEAVERDGDYFGPAVNLAARVMSAGHGGQIVCTDSAAALAPAIRTVALGEHQLRGVTARTVIHQLLADGLPTEFAALRSMDVARTNLPSEIAPPIGRDKLISQVCDAVVDTRLVTLTGVGGVGKTTVAINAGHRLTETARQGVWFIELTAVSDPDQILDAVAAGLRFSPSGGTPLRDALAEYLTGRDLILLLDNCEHIIDGTAETVRWLLQTLPTVRILTTSREALGISAERVVIVPPLDVPEGDVETDVGATAAGELFLARAADAGATWTLDQETAPAIAQICRSLDGIPLALELAAARSAQLSVADIASRLGSRLDVLGQARRSGEARHRTLVAALEWSHSLLEPHERRLFGQLGVFVDGFDVDAIIAVAAAIDLDEWTALDTLSALVSKSLVERHPMVAGRYRLLETVRAFVAALPEGDKPDQATARAHADHYLSELQAACQQLRTSDGVEETETLVADAANIEAGLNWCAANGHREKAFAPFVGHVPTLVTLLPFTFTYALLRPLERMVLEEDAERTPGFSVVCAMAALLLMEDPERERLPRIVEASRRAAGDANTALCQACGCSMTGDMVGGAALIRTGLKHATDPLLRASMLATLSVFETASGGPDALSHAEEALALAREHGGPLTQITPLTSVATASKDNVTRCVAAANEAQRLDRTVRRLPSGLAVVVAAQATAEAGDLASAVPLLRRSISEQGRAGSRTWLAVTVAGAADAIADAAPDAAMQLACLAESGAIKGGLAIFDNEGYTQLRRVAAAKDATELDIIRARYADLSYDDAVESALTILKDAANDIAGSAQGATASTKPPTSQPTATAKRAANAARPTVQTPNGD